MPTGPDPTKGLEHLVDEMWPATRVRLYDFPNHVIYRVDAAPVPFALGNALFMQPDGSPGWRATKEHGADVPYSMQHVHVCTCMCIYTYDHLSPLGIQFLVPVEDLIPRSLCIN